MKIMKWLESMLNKYCNPLIDFKLAIADSVYHWENSSYVTSISPCTVEELD